VTKVTWTSRALRDIEDIGDYIAQENPAAAERVTTRIFEQIDLLQELPYLGRVGVSWARANSL